MDIKFSIICFTILKFSAGTLDWDPSRPAFDPEIYEDALDPEVCSQQLQHIRSDTVLRLKFLEAGMRLPKGITDFNFLDMGNYDQCLGIDENIETSVIEGKYCMIRVPADSTFTKVAETLNWSEFDSLLLSEENFEKYESIKELTAKLDAIKTGVYQSRTIIGNISQILPQFQMALCVPKTCTTQEGIGGLLFDLHAMGFRYTEDYCRFKDDKPWVPADYVAIVIFSLIGFLTILSTGYDLFYRFMSKNDPKTASALYQAFSVYTNGKRLVTFTHNPNNLNCVDGIRAISMFWIIAGHTYVLMPPQLNVSYVIEYLLGFKSLWITASPYSVDTFFLLAGMLLVYTTVGKLSGKQLLKSLHLFYLNRLLRMFPLLATLVLLQVSLLHRIADGPIWTTNAENTNKCRKYWWSTLLYIQNYVNVQDQCLSHTWYLAIDIQCFIVSPIILYWVLNNKKNQAWGALTFGVLASLTICTTYSFIFKFQGWIIGQIREDGDPNYDLYHYFNTLTRAPPFFIGMLFGYILHNWKGRKLVISAYLNFTLWILAGGSMMTLVYITHLMKDASWDYWVIDDLNNSFGRSVWVVCVGWFIFSCQHGYAGPINWFLCLDIWKLPSRISYGIYLFHFHLIFMYQGTARQTVFFSDALAMYNFFAYVLISYGVAFALTLIIDSPCSVLIKLALGGSYKAKPHARTEKETHLK